MRYFKIIIPAIFCALILLLTKISIWYYPLLFGLVIGIVNWKAHKYNPYFGITLSVLVSFITFWLAYFSMGFFNILREFLLKYTNFIMSDDLMRELAFSISPFIIAPALVFVGFIFIFNYPKTKFSLYIIIGSIILLILDFVFFRNYSETSNYFKMIPYIIWQFIMVIAIQLIIYQKELNTINKP